MCDYLHVIRYICYLPEGAGPMKQARLASNCAQCGSTVEPGAATTTTTNHNYYYY